MLKRPLDDEHKAAPICCASHGMSLLFRPRHNTLAQISLFVLAAGGLGTLGGLMIYVRTPYARGMQDPIEQPLQFDHRHHTRDEGIDCRYCHNTVDKSPHASIPPTQLCLNCHSQVWNKSPLLEPVRQSFFENKPLEWRRVYRVPEFVYFNHSIHVNKGVGCVSCHGRVDQMAAVEKATPLTMGLVPRLPPQPREEPAARSRRSPT